MQLQNLSMQGSQDVGRIKSVTEGWMEKAQGFFLQFWEGALGPFKLRNS